MENAESAQVLFDYAKALRKLKDDKEAAGAYGTTDYYPKEIARLSAALGV